MTTATETATQVYRIYIKATPDAIWDAITKPEWTAKYGYRGIADYDLRPGGKYQARANEEMQAMGMPELVVDGEVLQLVRHGEPREAPVVLLDVEGDAGRPLGLDVLVPERAPRLDELPRRIGLQRTRRSRPTRSPASPGSTRAAAAGAGSSAT